MTIQKLGAPQGHFSNLSVKHPHKSASKIPSFPLYIQNQRTPHTFSKGNWFKLGLFGLASVGVVALTYYVFKRCLQISDSQGVKFRKKPDKGTFEDRLLNEASEINRDNFTHLVAIGNEAFNKDRLGDAEEYYAEALKTISLKDAGFAATCAKKLGIVYLQRANKDGPLEDRKEYCIKSAGLLNFGILLASYQNDDVLKKELQDKLIEVERFLNALCGAKTNLDNRCALDEKNRLDLKEIRTSVQKRLSDTFETPEDVKDLFQDITSEMKAFTARIIEQTLEVLGKPPHHCKFAVIGLGSMARGEMTPFSDVEFAILIEDGRDSEDVRQYFRNLTYLMHLRVLNLRETIVPILGIKALEGFYDDVTLRGFAFDGKGALGRGYKTPLGKKGVFELIQTPKKMASFQGKNGDGYWYEQDPFLPAELHNITYIYGENEIVKSYRRELDTDLKNPSREDLSLKEYYAKKHLIPEDVLAFEADYGFGEEGMLFELKKDLYRMPHLYIERLFLNECKDFSSEESSSGTFSKIDWLTKRGTLSLEGAHNLKWLFGKALLTRLKNCYKTSSAKSISDPLTDSSKDIDEEMCIINHLFCRAAKENLSCGKPLQGNIFYSNDPYLMGLIKIRFGKYLEASESLLKHLENNSDDVDGMGLLLRISVKLGDEKKSRNLLDRLTLIIKKLGPEKKAMKASHLSVFGYLYHEIGEDGQGSLLVEEVYNLVKDDPKLMDLYPFIPNNIGISYLKNRKLEKAQEVFEKFLLTLRKKTTGINFHTQVGALVACLFHLSCAHHLQHHASESIRYAEEALAIASSIYGTQHLWTAEILNNLGHYYFQRGSHEKGIQYFQQAVEITNKRLGEFHQTSIKRYLDLQENLNKIDSKKGLDIADYLKVAEKIETQNTHILNIIGCAWLRLYDYARAEKIFLKVIELSKEQKAYFELGKSYNLLANLYEECGKKLTALYYAELSLEVSRQVSENKPNETVVINLINVAESKTLQLAKGFVLDKISYKKSIHNILAEAEQMCMEIGKTASTNQLLSNVYIRWGLFEVYLDGDTRKAIDYFVKSLRLLESLYGYENASLIGPLDYMCQAYLLLPAKEEGSLDHLKRHLYLCKKNFGENSKEYITALRYMEQFEHRFGA